MDYSLKHPHLAQALYLALKTDPYFKFIQACIDADEAVAQQGMLAYMDYSIVEAQEFATVYMPSDIAYGVSVWSKPIDSSLLARKRQLKEKFFIQCLGEKASRLIRLISQQMGDNQRNFVQPSDWYLSIIGIAPEFQGQGLGLGLVEPILQQADELNVATYLETYSAKNHTFYQRLGYKNVAKFYQPRVKAEYWLMRRAAQKSEAT
ncbi:GNAT family N-acetyltransferase [Aliikangiella sp. IMCC44632]